uniref:Choline transporter-like protein n=1 Tax=Biomphalaria glabrata TaxID=6526 RepID=A0A2C9KIW3_BIOGL
MVSVFCVLHSNLKVIMLFIFFMYLWLKNFVCGLNQLTLAGVFASYYWTLDKTTLPKYTLLKSFYRCFRYHCGSLAFGSFLITFVQFLTALLNLVKSNIENSTNQLAKFLIRCLLCCFKLHDMFLQFINKRAYIMMAIEGKNFCLSAKRALSIMLNNFVKSLVLTKVTDFLLIISKLIITSMIEYEPVKDRLQEIGEEYEPVKDRLQEIGEEYEPVKDRLQENW